MDSDVIIQDHNCFVCGNELSINSRSVLDSTSYSEKPIYKFIESFVGLKFNIQQTTKAAICTNCLEEFDEYERICRRAAKIQDHISEVFTATQQKLKEPDGSIKCSTCFALFATKDEMDDHDCIVDETEDCIEFIAEEIEEFDNEGSSAKKKSKNEHISEYVCGTCNKAFEKKKDYSQHVKLAHLPDGAQVFTCELGCDDLQDNIFPTELELKFHYVIKHPTEPGQPLQCPGCVKTFSNKALLSRHFGLHLQDKPLVCELCGKRYYHSSSFHMHMVAHKGIKSHVCKECGRSFISTSHLNRHLKTHTGVKNYECNECGTKFAQRYNLRAHMNIHYGITRKKKPKQPVNVDYGDL
ncbi:hypothetical protein PVAND_015366 [Polypedilum vanderplanki]|uniref:C2H2-type domain-containing protein n=1 Tax=Polypedilum vanderplanki TaxID=319348 RepID=A0A9J6BCT9_POLVA|nr:hypothetical protein PVAND_015366 [Polypedilum vanderplanki]